jgi:hypothetical protein
VDAHWDGQRALTEQLAASLGILENLRFLG